jgi:hypothetical protein
MESLGREAPALALPECDQNENQRYYGQPQVPKAEACAGQQVVWFRFGRQPDAKDGGEK